MEAMPIQKLFVVGTPGCGKSAIIRDLIEQIVRDMQRSPIRFNDYKILREMFREDAWRPKEKKRFKKAPSRGFTVLFFEDFDEALQRLETKVEAEMKHPERDLSKPPFAIIEFARNDYQRAFQQFSFHFLQDAWFIYLDTDIEICKSRIHQRIAKPADKKTEDDYFVPDDIFETYYNYKPELSLEQILEECGLEAPKVLAINNNKTLKEIQPSIDQFICSIFPADSSNENLSAQDLPPNENPSVQDLFQEESEKEKRVELTPAL